jgi:hypothetical protein
MFWRHENEGCEMWKKWGGCHKAFYYGFFPLACSPQNLFLAPFQGTLKMEADNSSETSIPTYQTTRNYIQEYCHLHPDGNENLRSQLSNSFGCSFLCTRSRVSSDSWVGIATSLWLVGWGSIPGGARDCSALHTVQTSSEAQPASYSEDTEGCFRCDNAAGVWSWPLTSI